MWEYNKIKILTQTVICVSCLPFKNKVKLLFKHHKAPTFSICPSDNALCAPTCPICHSDDDLCAPTFSVCHNDNVVCAPTFSICHSDDGVVVCGLDVDDG